MPPKGLHPTIHKLLRIVERYAGSSASSDSRLRAGAVIGGSTGQRAMSTEPAYFFGELVNFCRAKLQPFEFQEALLDMGKVFAASDDFRKAEEAYGIVVQEALSGGDATYRAEALLERGRLYARMGQWRLSARDLEESRKMFFEIHEDVTVAEIDFRLGSNCAEQQLYREAGRYYTESLSRLKQLNHPTMSATIAMNMGKVETILGNYPEALRWFQEAFLIFLAEGNLSRLAELHLERGECYQSMGDHDSAFREFNESLQMSQKTGNNKTRLASLLGKARSFCARAEATMALLLCAEAEKILIPQPDEFFQAEFDLLRAMISADLYDFDNAYRLLQFSIAAHRHHDRPLHLGRAYFELGILEERRGTKLDALAAFRQAGGLFAKAGARKEAEKVRDAIKSLTETKELAEPSFSTPRELR